MADTKDSIGGPGTQGDTLTRSGSTEMEKDAQAAKHGAKEAAETAKQKAETLREQAKDAASDAAKNAEQKARNFADDKKDEAASRVGGMAHALRSAAGDLDEQNQDAVAGYARQAASGLEQVSDALSSRSLDDLVETVENFARRQPVAFLGGAALAGFVMARFAKSSAERRREQQHERYTEHQGYASAEPSERYPDGMATRDVPSHAVSPGGGPAAPSIRTPGQGAI